MVSCCLLYLSHLQTTPWVTVLFSRPHSFILHWEKWWYCLPDFVGLLRLCLCSLFPVLPLWVSSMLFFFFFGKVKNFFSFFLQSQPDSLCVSVSDFLPDSVCSAQLSLDSVKNRPQACGLCKAEQGAACGMHLKTQWHTLTVLECCLQLPQSAVAAAAYLEHGGTWCAGWIFGSRFI